MTVPLERMVDRLRCELATQALDEHSDPELLSRYVSVRDEHAFALIMRRHGGMVLSVCQRRLRNGPDAEDACQAVFLILSRRAAAIRQRESLASWLHGVALRVAARLRRQITRRQHREAAVRSAAATSSTADPSWRDVQAALDEEIGRLPERYRAPVLLCYLQGKTQDEAARQLGWRLPTLRGRLERARHRLRFRLSRRGLSLGAGLVSSGLSAVSAQAARSTIVDMVHVITSKSATPHVAALVQGVLQTMWWNKAKLCFGLTLLLVLLGAGGLLIPYRGLAESQPEIAVRADAAGNDAGQKEQGQTKIKLTYPSMIFRAEVEKELGLTEAQKNQFKKIQDDIDKKFDEEKKKIEALPALKEQQELSKLYVKKAEETKKQLRDQLAKSLDAKQLQRLHQLDLHWQAWEMTIFVNKEIADGLKFSEKQQKDAKKIFQDLHEDLKKLRGDKQVGDILLPALLDDHLKAMDKIQPIAAKRWTELLTVEQRETWTTWVGKPYKFDTKAVKPKYK